MTDIKRHKYQTASEYWASLTDVEKEEIRQATISECEYYRKTAASKEEYDRQTEILDRLNAIDIYQQNR